MNFKNRSKILITCSKGISQFLTQEINDFGFEITDQFPLGLYTVGSLDDTIKLNLQSRTALRVLYHLSDFNISSPENLYKNVYDLSWEDILPVDGYFSVTSSVLTPSIKDSRFANLKVKDAIVDRMVKLHGRRPNSGPDRSNSVIFLYWRENFASLFIDTSGEALSKRGYRKIPGFAPMQETLAAAVIMATGWDKNSTLINPMCGSGTIGIEAALFALEKAPGLLRNNFGFMHIKGYDKNYYLSERKKLRDKTKKQLPCRIQLSDIDQQMVSFAKMNAKTAGVDHIIDFSVCPFELCEIPAGHGVIFLNPPYGKRLNDTNNLEDLYKRIGDFFKKSGTGKQGFIFTGNLDMAKRVGLKSKKRLIFYNGKIESRLLEYELYQGSKKPHGESK